MITSGICRDAGVWLGYHQAHLRSKHQTPIEPHDCAVWFGRGASVLDLPVGDVDLEKANRLFRNFHPITGAPLRSKSSEVALFECTYSAPKSFSLLTVFDERLPTILMRAAMSGLAVLERHVATRERKGTLHRTNAVTPTNNISALCVPNFTNRAGEPQAHVHAGIANLTLDELDVEWTAIEISWLFQYESRLLLDATCHNELAWHLRALGYPIVRTDRSFEIDGIAEETLAKISTRRNEVLETAANLREERALLESLEVRTDHQQSRLRRLQRLDNRDIRDLAARESRSAKTEPSFEKVVHDLRRRLTIKERDTIARVVDQARNRRTEPVHPTFAVGTAAARILSREFVMTCASLTAQVLTENPGLIRSAPDGLPWSAGDFINLRDGFVADRLAWDRISMAIDTLIARRGASPALHPTASGATPPQAGWISKILSATSQWMLYEGSFPLKGVIEALKDAGISAGSALHGATERHIVVLGSVELLPTLMSDAFVLSRILIVRNALRSGPVEELLCRKLVENGVATTISVAQPQARFSTSSESTFLDEASGTLLNTRGRRGRFTQFLAGGDDEVAAFTKKVRALIHKDAATPSIVIGDTVRAIGNNRLGAQRTYRSRLYAICGMRDDGSLLATNGLIFPFFVPTHRVWFCCERFCPDCSERRHRRRQPHSQ